MKVAAGDVVSFQGQVDWPLFNTHAVAFEVARVSAAVVFRLDRHRK